LEKAANNRYLKLTLKLGFSLITLLFVLYQINWQSTWSILKESNILLLLVAVLLFNLSQIVSAKRLQHLFDSLRLRMSSLFNIKLYYLGMFYNLLLPGGIGGDAYKIYLLKQNFQVRTRRLFQSILLDRLSGLVALLVLAMILALRVFNSEELLILIIFVLTIAYPLFYGIWQQLFRRFKRKFITVNFMALIVQVLQVICVLAIMKSTHVNSSYETYLLIFLISSVATIIPITVGGLGLREVVFLYGSRLFDINQEVSISISLIFFLITVTSSLPGLFINTQSAFKKEEQATQQRLAHSG